ncbi:glycosyltransferase family 4 protein [Massilia sp. TN1-12]|uniref:glycosyltransferase family 4 protein n=1 Tax=Massilia paldalensis TaxID=3377675 RepID=UPI00384B8930
MKLLTFSTLFPNAAQPNHGLFVETRLRYLVGSGQVQSRVVAPVPWFPSTHPRFGHYATLARVPREEQRGGIDIVHPRYPAIPKIGMTAAPMLMAQAVKPAIGRILDSGYDFDVIDAHYFYPDGVAAVMLGKYFNKPVVVTARGTDINLIPGYTLPRKMILWAASNARAVITVCSYLKDEMVKMGVQPQRITPLRNGVDLQRFMPDDRDALRAQLDVRGFTLLSVGHLNEHKGHHLAIEALRTMPDVSLMIAGHGPDRNKLEQLARQLGVAARVRFLGPVPQAELRAYYNAADSLVLASSREGWANVLLESMACGTPVVATSICGTPEVVSTREAGRLMPERSAESLAETVRLLRADLPARSATRRFAENFSWDATTQGQIDLFQHILTGQH